jgi:hypothetical protein
MPAILIRVGSWETSFLKKNHHPMSKTFYLAAINSKVIFVHFLSQCGNKEKSSKKGGLEG